MGIKNNCYEFCICDTGIEFQIETLLKLGLEPVTTHKETGGTGIGFISTFETLKKCNASLIIDEKHEESNNDYTKSVTIKFDGKSQYIIKSYRADKIKDKAETIYLNLLYAKDFVKSIASGTVALVKQATQWVVNTGAKIANTAATIAGTVATTAATAATWLFNTALTVLTSPITLVVAAIAALIAIVVLLIIAGISIGAGNNAIKNSKLENLKNKYVINRSKRKRIC